MHAEPGDWLIVKGATVGAVDETGEIVEVPREDGSPPYRVRWLRDGREALVFPGTDARIMTAAEKARADARERRRIEEIQREILREGPTAHR